MISIIIPTYNEAEKISTTLYSIFSASYNHQFEIIVADGGSTDDTVAIAKSFNVTVLENLPKGRSKQLNAGAQASKGNILYFLHADSIPPENFTHHIIEACSKGAVAGCCRLTFDDHHWFLKTQCWFTRFNINAVRFGDQSLFVTKEVFEKCGGYREDHLIMEDQEIIPRIRTYGKFKVLNQCVTTSSRKYRQNGIFRTQGIFYCLWLFYYLGFSQQQLAGLYKKWIRNNSL